MSQGNRSDRIDGAVPDLSGRTAPAVAAVEGPFRTRGASERAIPRVIRALRSLAGAARRESLAAFERALHPRRRTRAIETLHGLPTVGSVLFICHGNIYRSPYAEAAFRALTRWEGGPDTLSAGFVGPDRPAPDASIELARSRGRDLSGHRSQLVTNPLVSGSDLIVVMSAQQKRWICERFGYPARRVLVLGDLDPETPDRRTVIDPWNRPPEVLLAAADRIERCLSVLVVETPLRRGIPGV